MSLETRFGIGGEESSNSTFPKLRRPASRTPFQNRIVCCRLDTSGVLATRLVISPTVMSGRSIKRTGTPETTWRFGHS